MNRHGWLFVSVSISMIVFSGCAKDRGGDNNSGNGGWSAFPVPIYSDAIITATPQAEADLKDAMSFWEAKAGRKLFDYQGAYPGGTPYSGTSIAPGTIIANVIMLQNPWPFAMNIAGQTTVDSASGAIESAVVMINPNIPFCGGDCTGAVGQTSQRRTFAHELGHFLGLTHNQDLTNIMYPQIQPGGTLNTVTIDQPALDGLTIGQ